MTNRISRRAALGGLIGISGSAYALDASDARSSHRKFDYLTVVAEHGTKGDGVTDDTAAFQKALDSVPKLGGIVFVPEGRYPLKCVYPRRNSTIVMSPGATLMAVRQDVHNQLFGLLNTPMATVRLVTALQGESFIDVDDAREFSAGDRIIVSGGTFRGSGVEEGPIEFNTVRTLDGRQRVTLEKPLQYSYTRLGLPEAFPRVHRLGDPDSFVSNVRITGGTLAPFGDFNSIYFNFANVENVEIDHVVMDGLGGGVATGHNVSRLSFHDNIVGGRAQAEGHGIDIASVVESRFAHNAFNVCNDAGAVGQYNHIVLEVACRDNLIIGNDIGPVRSAGTAGIEFTFYSFGNRIADNRIWGCDSDLRSGHATLGIRTFANGYLAHHHGNQIIGNKISDLMHGIGDGQTSSVITGNMVINTTLHPKSIGINCVDGDNTSPFLGNSFSNVASEVKLNDGTPGGFSILSGEGDPPPTGGVGSLYLQRSAGPGRGLWRRERIGKAMAWVPLGQPPSVSFSEIGPWPNGSLLYVTDGTPASAPLRGNGSGCLAARENGSWRAL